MEDENGTPSVAESAKSSVEETAVAGPDVGGHSSSEGSRKRQAPGTGPDVEESTLSLPGPSRREQRDVAADVDKSGTGTKESTGEGNSNSSQVTGSNADINEQDCPGSVVPSTDLLDAGIGGKGTCVNTQSNTEIYSDDTLSNTTYDSSAQDVEDPIASTSNIPMPTSEVRQASQIASTSREMREDMNTFPVMDECLEQVDKEGENLRKHTMNVLEKFGMESSLYGDVLLAYWDEDPPQSPFRRRFQAVDDYLNIAYSDSTAQMDVASSSEQDAREASTSGSSGNSEGNARKKRKIQSDFSAEAAEGESLEVEVETDVEEPAEMAVERTERDCAGCLVQHIRTGCNGQSANTQGEVVMSCTVSSTSHVPAEQGVDAVTAGSAAPQDLRSRMTLARDFLVTSAKSVAFVTLKAVNIHGLRPLLLNLSEAALDQDSFKMVDFWMTLVPHYVNLALEAAEAAARYHRNVANYLAEPVELAPDDQVSGGPGDAAIWEVIRAADELQEIGLMSGDSEQVTQERREAEVQALARILSPALRRAEEANAFTKEVLEKLDQALLHKLMTVMLKGATSFALFVISLANRVLDMVSDSLEVDRDG